MFADIPTLARRRPAPRAAGFTTVELVVILIVIGVLAATALPKLSSDPVVLSTQSEQLASDVRYVQTLAMTQGQRYTITFPSATTYQFLNSAGVAVPHPMGGGTTTTLKAGVTMLVGRPLKPGGDSIGFDGQGTPYGVTAPSTFVGPLTSQAIVTLTKNTATRTVQIYPQVGVTRVQ